MRNTPASKSTDVAAAVGTRLQDWATQRRASDHRKALERLGIVDGVSFGVKLAVGLGPETRFELEWWHRLVRRMRADGSTSVVLSLSQIEWLLDQVPVDEPAPGADVTAGPRSTT